MPSLTSHQDSTPCAFPTYHIQSATKFYGFQALGFYASVPSSPPPCSSLHCTTADCPHAGPTLPLEFSNHMSLFLSSQTSGGSLQPGESSSYSLTQCTRPLTAWTLYGQSPHPHLFMPWFTPLPLPGECPHHPFQLAHFYLSLKSAAQISPPLCGFHSPTLLPAPRGTAPQSGFTKYLTYISALDLTCHVIC